MESSERRKAIELLKEMRTENKEDDSKSSNQEACLNWIYKGPSDLVDKEEYLLGRAIDKTFEFLQSGGNSDIIGRIGEQSNIPKKLLEKTESTEQVDIAKKILEDPLYAIKQKEMEARKKLLNNPVKLKQIKQMLLERSKQISSKERKKKKKKSEQDLNLIIIKKLKKFTDREKRKALNKIMQSNSSSSSTDSSPRDKKHKSKERHSSSDESDSSSNDSEENKKERKSRKKNTKNKKSKESVNYSDRIKGKKSERKRSKKSYSSSESESVDSEKSQENDNRKSKNPKAKCENDSRYSSRKNRNNERQEKDKRKKEGRRRNESSGEERKFKKTYGLMMPDGSKPEVKKRTSPVKKYPKNAETKVKYVPPPPPKPLSEKERDEMLKEMMKNAKLRKEDREKNLASHRRKQALEEESKTYDNDFMRRQMSQLTSQGTMADRIKSNINNIQRSSSSMDTSFMQK